MVISSVKELAIMKDGVGIVNCARGGVIDEVALVKKPRQCIIRRLRCFESEPKPEMTILMHPKVSLTHTLEQQLEKPKIELEQNLLHKLSVYW
jgi:phosphoglycerate dehydrogenase-like enzyme